MGCLYAARVYVSCFPSFFCMSGFCSFHTICVMVVGVIFFMFFLLYLYRTVLCRTQKATMFNVHKLYIYIYIFVGLALHGMRDYIYFVYESCCHVIREYVQRLRRSKLRKANIIYFASKTPTTKKKGFCLPYLPLACVNVCRKLVFG